MKKPNTKYTRPKPKHFTSGLNSRCYDFADVIEKHLKIRLREETNWLLDCSRKQTNQAYIEWFKHTEKHNPSLISKEVSRLTSKKNPIDFYSEEGQYLIGKSLLDKFVRTKRNDVIDLRKALGLEYRRYSNNSIILTNGIETSDLFRLFGSPLTFEDLKNNYKTLAKHCHPDTNGSLCRRDGRSSDELMAKVNNLYKKLEEKWEIYDPANLGVPKDKLKSVLNKRVEDPDLVNLMSFW